MAEMSDPVFLCHPDSTPDQVKLKDVDPDPKSTKSLCHYVKKSLDVEIKCKKGFTFFCFKIK